jgi:hypothetical protein
MLGIAGTAQAGNLLTNGGFEAGNLSGWTQSGDTSYAYIVNGTNPVAGAVVFTGPQAGSYYFLGGPASTGYLSQTFSDTAGANLTVSGWVATDGLTPDMFSMNFDGTNLVTANNISQQGWTKYSFVVTGTGSDTFKLGYQDNPNAIAFDSFSVSSVAGVPEPATWAMMLFGVGMIGAGLRVARRKNDVSPTSAIAV